LALLSKEGAPDLAVLDINFGSQKVFSVADAVWLCARLFVFAHARLAEAALSVLREHEELLTEPHR
jgi:hypothetical protein